MNGLGWTAGGQLDGRRSFPKTASDGTSGRSAERGSTDGRASDPRSTDGRNTDPWSADGRATNEPAGGRPAPVDRRSVLRGAGVIGLAGIGGLVALPSPPSGPSIPPSGSTSGSASAAVTDDVPYQGETVTSEDDAPIARYQYRPAGDEYVPTAPINVVFPLADREAGLETVMGVLDELGWTRRPEEYARFAWDREAERYVHQEATAAETYQGMHGRLHVRCWEFEGVVSMQTHEDSRPWPRHEIDSYERARAVIESLFDAEGWTRYAARIDLANGKSPDHDGRATVIGA